MNERVPAADRAPANSVQAPEQDAPSADTGTTASTFGKLAEGFAANLGVGLHFSDEQLEGGSINLESRRQPLPGVTLKEASYNRRRESVSITGELAIPYVDHSEVTITINSSGVVRLRGGASKQLNLPALGNPEISVSIEEDGQLAGDVTIQGAQLTPRRARNIRAEGSGTLRIRNGMLSGNGQFNLAYNELGQATINFNFAEDGAFAADGEVRITPPFVEEITGSLSVDNEQNLNAEVTAAASILSSPLPGLTIMGGSLTVGYHNGTPSGSITDFRASYSGFGSVHIATGAIDENRQFSAAGAISLEVPMLDGVSGTLAVRRGVVSGSLTIDLNSFPRGLPISASTITASLSDTGALSVTGSAAVNLGPAGTGDLDATYSDSGEFAIAAEADLTIPGLQGVHVGLAFRDGHVEGDASVPIDNARVPGITGDVNVGYHDGLWSGETDLQFSADNGKLAGNVHLTITQTEEGDLQLGGGGDVTAQLMPRLSGTLRAELLPEGGVDVSGAITVTEPLELFPEERMEKELFRYSQNIPLWAILVAIIRVRAGVRSGIGPGVFRNITVEGSYTLGAEESDPSFSISGELFIPAFVEGYVAFGAGLGLDVVLGSLTGGIEGVATAGLYGAISVVPELNYDDGNWTIEGTATLAAGARLKLGLNAWAEVEALWVTVWEQEWELAEHVMAVGPDLGLQAKMSYTFGQPTPPEIEMNTSDIDTDSMIQEAMPKDGPAGSGARDALNNKAEWQGALREQRQAAVPAETAAQANSIEQPPAAPARPPRAGGPGDRESRAGAGGQSADTPGRNQDPTATPGDANQPARSQAAANAAQTDSSVQGSVPPSQLPNANQERYPTAITLQMLDEPPAPTPRTRDQEGADSRAALKAVELAAREASNSDTLDNYFPRIKRRFGLASLGYEGDFQSGFKVVGKINPDFEFTPMEPLSGSGIPIRLTETPATSVKFNETSLGGDSVGIGMEAYPLGPDHGQGSGPSGQGRLMGMLPVDPRVYRAADSKYVRGHLLNDNVGGRGTPENLFPITSQANARHHAEIEQSVKNWVNDRKLWVYYSVEVVDRGSITPSPNGKNFINAKFRARAHVLTTGLRPAAGLSRTATINSQYEVGNVNTVSDTQQEDSALLDQFSQAQAAERPLDQGLDIQLSSRHRTSVYKLPRRIFNTLRAQRDSGKSWQDLKRQLTQHSGFGDRSFNVLTKAYRQVFGKDPDSVELDLETTERGVLTRIINAWPVIEGYL